MDDREHEEDPEEVADVGNVRLYSDFLLYFAKAGRIQHHPLLDSNRQRGVMGLLGSERVTKLTRDRRLKPVVMTMVPGTQPQRVYLVAIVRESVSLEELTDLVQRVNDRLDGLSSDEKEEAVQTLIRRTGSRVLPGIPWLPRDFYQDDEFEYPSRPRRSHRRDRDGKLVQDSDDEYIVAKPGKPNPDARKRDFVPLPRKSAKIPEPYTDSETSSSSGSSKFAQPASKGGNKRGHAEPERKGTGSPSKKSKPTKETGDEGDYELEDPEDVTEPTPPPISAASGTTGTERTQSTASQLTFRPQEWGLSTERPESGASTQTEMTLQPQDWGLSTQRHESGVSTQTESLLPPEQAIAEIHQRVTNMEKNLGDQMKTLVEEIGHVRDFLDELRQGPSGLDRLQGAIERTDAFRTQRQSVQSSLRSTPSEEPTPEYNEAENMLMKYFPVNEYTKAMHWLLKHDVVRTFLEYRTMRAVYKGFVPSKPDMEIVLAKFLDLTVSLRLQAHLGKPVTDTSPLLHFGRFPMPQPLYKIATEDLKGLSKKRAEGMKDEADILKDKCLTAKRTCINANTYACDAESIEETALRLYWERMDFFQKHKHHFPDENPANPSWTFKKELKVVKDLACGKNKPSDATVDTSQPIPSNLEDLMFRTMNKGKPIHSMTEARALLEALRASPLTTPRFSDVTWELIREEVQPSKEETAFGRKRMAEQQAVHKRRLARRRAAYRKKHGKEAENDDDLETSHEKTFTDDEGLAPADEESVHINVDVHDENVPEATEETENTVVLDNVNPNAIVVDLTAPRDVLMKQLFGEQSSSSSSGKQTVTELVVPFGPPGHESAIVPTTETHQEPQVAGQTNPVDLSMAGNVYAMAKNSGVIAPADEATVEAAGSSMTSMNYSVTAKKRIAHGSTTETRPVTISGTMTTSTQVDEVLNVPESLSGQDILESPKKPSPPKPLKKTLAQRFEEFEENPLDYKLTSSSSSSESKGQKTSQASKGSSEPDIIGERRLSVLESIKGSMERTHSTRRVAREKREKAQKEEEEAYRKTRGKGKGKSSRGRKK